MLDLSCIDGSTIQQLLDDVTDDSVRDTQDILSKLSAENQKARHRVLKSLLVSLSVGPSHNSAARAKLLRHLLVPLLSWPSSASIVCDIIEVVPNPTQAYFDSLSELLKFSPVHSLLFGLSLSHHPIREKAIEGLNLVRRILPSVGSRDLANLSPETLQSLLQFRQAVGVTSVAESFGDISASSCQLTTDYLFSKIPDPSVNTLFSMSVLSGVLRDLGPECCASKESFLRVLASVGDLTPADLAEAIVYVANSHSTPPISSWSIDNFIDALRDAHPGLDWHAVVQRLDFPTFMVVDAKAFAVMFTILRKGIREPQFPSKFFLRRWANVDGQLSLLRCAVQMPPELLNFAQSSERRMTIDIPGFVGKTLKHATWNSIDLLKLLLELADESHIAIVRDVLDGAKKQFPEIVLIALFEAKVSHLRLAQEVCLAVMRKEMAKLGQNAPLLQHLWNADQSLFTHSLIDLFYRDSSLVFRILDLAHELKILSTLLSGKNLRFVLDLAVLAAKREFLNLRIFLSKRLSTDKEEFGHAMVTYLADKLLPMSDHSPSLLPRSSVDLPAEVVAIFIVSLEEGWRMLADTTMQRAQRVFSALYNHFPQLKNVRDVAARDKETKESVRDTVAPVSSYSPSPSGTVPSATGQELRPQVSAEIEQIADSLFRKVYSLEISVDDLCAQLAMLRSSGRIQDSQLADCVVYNLLDEFRFFEDYPKNYLAINAQLYGHFIARNLMVESARNAAIQQLYQCLRKPTDSKLYGFAIAAVTTLCPRLREYPDILECLSQIADGSQDSRLRSLIDSAPRVGGSSSVSSSKPPVADRTAQGIAEQEAVAHQDHVPEEVQSRVHFILNNITTLNMNSKVQELAAVLSPVAYRYFAYYLVCKRAAAELNNLALYVSIMETLGRVEIWDLAFQVTLERIKILLESRKITQVAAERSTLKNLGSWLGAITLAKNKPLLRRHLDLKELLLDAYDKGRLIAVVPFVAKVLEGCAKSRAFRPPNPWTMSILSIMHDLYRLPDLKMTLKFEVEVLCKHLDVSLQNVSVRNVLKDRVVLDRVSSPDFTGQPASAAGEEATMKRSLRTSPALPPSSPPFSPGQPPVQPSAVPVPQSNQLPSELIEAIIHNVVVDLQLFHYVQDPQLKTKVASALHKGVSDVLGPVVERSVTIACITTRDVVRKDFVFDADESRVRSCAQAMVQRLTSSLALVTCRDPLRTTFLAALRQLVSAPVSGGQQVDIEPILVQLVNDNLDLGCRIIERSAVDRAIVEMEKMLDIEIYRPRREFHTGVSNGSFVDVSAYETMQLAFRNCPTFPSALKPSPGMPTTLHVGVYEEFLKMSFLSSTAVSAQSAVPPSSSTTSTGETETIAPADEASSRTTADFLTVDNVLRKLHSIMDEIDKLVALEMQRANEPLRSLVAFPRDHPIIQLLTMIPQVLSEAGNLATKTETAFAFSKEVLSRILDELSQFGMELQFNILEAVRVVVTDLPLLLTEYACSAEIARLLRRPITFTLLRAGILSAKKMDPLLAALVARDATSGSTKDAGALEFSVSIVRKLVIEDRSVHPSDIPTTLDVLQKFVPLHRPEIADGLRALVNIAMSSPASSDSGMPSQPATSAVSSQPMPQSTSSSTVIQPAVAAEQSRFVLKSRDHDVFLIKLFEEWVGLFSSSSNEQNVFGFLSKLEQSGLLRASASFGSFFKTSGELAVDNCLLRLREDSGASGAQTDSSTSFLTVDAFSKLMFLIARWFIKPDMPMAKAPLIKTVLDVFGRILMEDASFYGPSFDQRPYLRFMQNVLLEIVGDTTLETVQLPLLVSFAETLDTVSPLRCPQFAFAWLHLFAHKELLSRLLAKNGPLAGAAVMRNLLVSLLSFMAPALTEAAFSAPFRDFYRGVLRVFLVIVHDFPEFLCDYHLAFCDVIPANCVQLRNLVLSAFPSSMRLPDPFTPNLRVDLLPEIQQAPRVLVDPAEILRARHPSLLEGLADYLVRRHSAVTFLSTVADMVKAVDNDPVVINALVLHCGMVTIEQLQRKVQGMTIVDSAATDIFKRLLIDLSSAGRYTLINGMANQLRYPNNHTHYFSCILLYLFAELQVDGEKLQEIITRVLFERLIVNRPHPWGLLITFIELVKNPRYAFWQRSFIHCAPEINRLFDNVARSCESATANPA